MTPVAAMIRPEAPVMADRMPAMAACNQNHSLLPRAIWRGKQPRNATCLQNFQSRQSVQLQAVKEMSSGWPADRMRMHGL